jgi:tRNA (guanine37-N1)-methyltransferase
MRIQQQQTGGREQSNPKTVMVPRMMMMMPLFQKKQQQEEKNPWTREEVDFHLHNNTDDDDAVGITTTTPAAAAAAAIADTKEDWRTHTAFHPTIEFRSWKIHSPNLIPILLNSNITRPYLATTMTSTDDDDDGSNNYYREIMDNLQIRIKAVIPCPDEPHCKFILLRPDYPSYKPESLQQFLQAHNVTQGPIIPMTFQYRQFKTQYILSKVLPPEAHPPPTAFEMIGRIAHLNFHNPLHLPYRYVIGQILQETCPNMDTVLAKMGQVSGPYRTYPYEILAGNPSTHVQLVEAGIHLSFDLAQVYWCTRLAEERQRLLKIFLLHTHQTHDHHPKKKEPSHIVVADAFCGVGALCVLAAREGIQVHANDWNPHAIESLRNNARDNHVEMASIQCGDAYDFLTDLGIRAVTPQKQQQQRQRSRGPRQQQRKQQRARPKEVAANTTATTSSSPQPPQPANEDKEETEPQQLLPDHVVLNYPLRAAEFLGALRWWPSNTQVIPRVHVYIFARDQMNNSNQNDDQDTTVVSYLQNDENTEVSSFQTAEAAAVEEIARNLLPPLHRHTTRTTTAEPNDITTEHCPPASKWLNEMFGCNVETHAVRDVAPGKTVFCVSFSATPALLRCMQGDFR